MAQGSSTRFEVRWASKGREFMGQRAGVRAAEMFAQARIRGGSVNVEIWAVVT